MTDPASNPTPEHHVESTVAEPPTVTEPLTVTERPDQTDLIWMHGLFLCMALAVIGASFLMRFEGQQSVFLPGTNQALPEVCAAKRIFGIPCPGCGLTRSFISISHGQFAPAWHLNPTSLILYPFILAQIPWHTMQIWLIRKRGHGAQLPYIHFFPIAIAVIMLVRWLTTVPQLF